MEFFEKAIVRTPSETFAKGITPGFFGKADASLAMDQHRQYVEALKQCGLSVRTLEADPDFPDSCFVEDPVIVTDRVAILTNFGAASRAGEAERIRPEIEALYEKKIERIQAPGTVEGGDICQVNDHFFIGLSQRTNEEGACQLAQILKKHGFTSSIISIRAMRPILHLKTGLSYLGNNVMICHPAIAPDSELDRFEKIIVKRGEEYASNCIRVNDYVIIPKGFADAIAQVQQAGFKTLELDMSEFMKQDGGLSCLSLRVPPIS